MTDAAVDIYDGRTGTSFDLRSDPGSAELRSADAGFTVLRGRNVSWESAASVIEQTVALPPTRLIIFRPWFPGSRVKVDQLHRAWNFEPLVAAGPVQIGTTTQTNAQLTTLIHMIGDAVLDGGGVGLVAATSEPPTTVLSRVNKLLLQSDPMLFLIAGLLDCIDVAVAFDESAESTVFLRDALVNQDTMNQIVKAALIQKS